VELYRNNSGRKLDPGGMKRYRGGRNMNREVEERDRRKVR